MEKRAKDGRLASMDSASRGAGENSVTTPEDEDEEDEEEDSIRLVDGETPLGFASSSCGGQTKALLTPRLEFAFPTRGGSRLTGTPKTASTPPKSSDMPKRSSPKTPGSGSKRAIEDPQGSTSSTEANDASKRLKLENRGPLNGGRFEGGENALASSPIKEPGWASELALETSKPYFSRLQTFLDEEYASSRVIYPPRDAVFNAFESCPLDKVKVVVLGQDPYHQPGQAHGLAFSVMKGIAQPPSLRNMVKEAESCCGIRPTRAGTLDKWCQQGVLLLNSLLTVQRSKPMAHKNKGWEQFTDAVIRELNKGKRRVVFMLWGKPSQKKGGFIDASRHRVVKCAHPSPLSATKGPEPFIGSACFRKANEALEELGHEAVDWNIE